MDLNVGMLHEGDFFKLLAYLDRTAKGAYTISECTFRMNGNELEYEKNHANIYAFCLLHWITINVASGIGIEI